MSISFLMLFLEVTLPCARSEKALTTSILVDPQCISHPLFDWSRSGQRLASGKIAQSPSRSAHCFDSAFCCCVRSWGPNGTHGGVVYR